MVGASVRRQQVDCAKQRGFSLRRACALSTFRRLPVAHAAQYPRYGYRRIQVLMKRLGHAMILDKAC